MPLDIKDFIRTIPDYPRPGVMFRDVTSLLRDARAFKAAMEQLFDHCTDMRPDMIVAIEARGFIFGSALALHMDVGFVPVRKKGKLPGDVISHDYALEYGTDSVEIHSDALPRGARVLLVDDLIATGGTAAAAVALAEKLGASVEECCFIIELPELNGRRRLEKMGQKVFSLCTFDGR